MAVMDLDRLHEETKVMKRMFKTFQTLSIPSKKYFHEAISGNLEAEPVKPEVVEDSETPIADSMEAECIE